MVLIVGAAAGAADALRAARRRWWASRWYTRRARSPWSLAAFVAIFLLMPLLAVVPVSLHAGALPVDAERQLVAAALHGR